MDLIKEKIYDFQQQQSYIIRNNDQDYQVYIGILDQKITYLKWQNKFSVEDLKNGSTLLRVCDTIEEALNYIQLLLEQNKFYIQETEKNLTLYFLEICPSIVKNLQINLVLLPKHEEINTKETVRYLRDVIIDLEQKKKDLQSSFNQEKQINLEEIHKIIKKYVKLPERKKLIQIILISISILIISVSILKFCKDFLFVPWYLDQQIHSLQIRLQEKIINYQSRMNDQDIEFTNKIAQLQSTVKEQQILIEKLLQQQYAEENKSSILYQSDINAIGYWIHGGNMQMELNLLYKGSKHGFKIETFYKKAISNLPTLILIEATTSKRFGGFTDLKWDINFGNTGYVQTENNKSFLFSLDENKKYTSNEKKCENAIFKNYDVFQFGQSDLTIYSNSNVHEKSFNLPKDYGKNEGFSGKNYMAGTYYFRTKEIEVYEVILKQPIYN